MNLQCMLIRDRKNYTWCCHFQHNPLAKFDYKHFNHFICYTESLRLRYNRYLIVWRFFQEQLQVATLKSLKIRWIWLKASNVSTFLYKMRMFRLKSPFYYETCFLNQVIKLKINKTYDNFSFASVLGVLWINRKHWAR